MEEDEDYDSDSTVLLTDIPKNPEKIARKRRRLDAKLGAITQTNTQCNAESSRMNVSSENVQRDRQPMPNLLGDLNNDTENKQWRIDQFFAKQDNHSNNNDVHNWRQSRNKETANSSAEDLTVKRELLKQEMYEENNDDNASTMVSKDFVLISDDSDDDCAIISNDDLIVQVDKDKKLNPRISVLTPSSINTRRATLDSFESNKTVDLSIQKEMMSKIAVLKPSAINARRATINCIESYENRGQTVHFCNKNKVIKDSNENSENANERFFERTSSFKRTNHSEHLLKHLLTTPKEHEASRRRDGGCVIQEKLDLGPKVTASSVQNSSHNLQTVHILSKEYADVLIKAKTKKTSCSSSVKGVCSSENTSNKDKNVVNKNVQQEPSGVRVDLKVVKNYVNNAKPDYKNTAQVSSVEGVGKLPVTVAVSKDNNVQNRKSDASNIKEAGSYIKDQMKNPEPNITVGIGLLEDTKTGNKRLSHVDKSIDAKRVKTGEQTLNNIASCSIVVNNTGKENNSVLENLQNIFEENAQQDKECRKPRVDIDSFDDNIVKSTEAKSVRPDEQTPNNDACSSNVINNTNNEANSVLKMLHNIFEGHVAQQDDSPKLHDTFDDNNKGNERMSKVIEMTNAKRITDKQVPIPSVVNKTNPTEISVLDNLKSVETKEWRENDAKKINKPRKKQSTHTANQDQETNQGETGKAGYTKNKNKYNRVVKFQVSFFKLVKQFLKEITEKRKLLRASPNKLINEIKLIIRNVKKEATSEIQYACPKCAQVTVYSPEARYQMGDDNKPSKVDNTLKCKLCRGLKILHTSHMKTFSQNNMNVITMKAVGRFPNEESLNPNLNNDFSTKSSQNQNINDVLKNKEVSSLQANKGSASFTKESTSTEISEQNLPIALCQDTIQRPSVPATNSSDKAKTNKRTVNADRAPTEPKRVRFDTDTQHQNKNVTNTGIRKNQSKDNTSPIIAKKSSSVPNETPSSDNISQNKISDEDDMTNKVDIEESVARDNDKIGRGDEKDASYDDANSKVIQALVECFTQLKDSRNTNEDKPATSGQSSTNNVNFASQFAESIETLVNTKTTNMQYTCPICTCVFISQTDFFNHMKENHNCNIDKPEMSNRIKCAFCEIVLKQNEYNSHVKECHSEECLEDNNNTEEITKNSKNENTSFIGGGPQQQNKSEVATPNEEKHYECLICKQVLNSSYATKNHRQQAHKHLDLRNQKLFKAIDIKRIGQKRKSLDGRSSAIVDNENNDDKSSSGKQQTITNQVTETVGSSAVKRREGNERDKINQDVNESTVKESNDDKQYFSRNSVAGQVPVPQYCDEQAKSNGTDNGLNKMQEVKQANVTKSQDKPMYKCLLCKETFSVSGARKHRKSQHKSLFNVRLFDKVLISEVIDEPNSGNEATGEESKINKDDQYDMNDTLDDAENTQNKASVQDKRSRQLNKGNDIIPTKLKDAVSSFANCYNCRTNFDVNADNNHACTPIVLFNCYLCGVNVQIDDKHNCTANENDNCIENIKITNIVTIKELYVFKCQDCKLVTDVYDDVIRHCQNHYNEIKSPTAYCETCQVNYDIGCFETHQHLHEKEIKIINYSYKLLFSNWDRIFNDIPTDTVKEIQASSIYKTHCIKMKVIVEGPWKYSLYQCEQCDTCVTPEEVEQHSREDCYFMSYPCSSCEQSFTRYQTCANHELDHQHTEQFRVIQFNRKKDERFNLKLIEARKLQMDTQVHKADIYKCQCGLYFVNKDKLKNHFVTCDLESYKGIICHRCAAPRLFESDELENHLRVHHGSVTYIFRVNSLTITIEEETEPCDDLNRENRSEIKDDGEHMPVREVSDAETDIKRELLKE